MYHLVMKQEDHVAAAAVAVVPVPGLVPAPVAES